MEHRYCARLTSRLRNRHPQSRDANPTASISRIGEAWTAAWILGFAQAAAAKGGVEKATPIASCNGENATAGVLETRLAGIARKTARDESTPPGKQTAIPPCEPSVRGWEKYLLHNSCLDKPDSYNHGCRDSESAAGLTGLRIFAFLFLADPQRQRTGTHNPFVILFVKSIRFWYRTPWDERRMLAKTRIRG